ncbi:MAG: tRNA 2-thiouridine(34) synthase MnmA [Bacteroidetes bacterium]|nr:tRNA 2-thiouridine(34) synthase MnmA [Bacteroidota bacterium]
MARVVVGLSGGVDSSVAALLLQQAGHEVIGMYMRNWHNADVTINNECPWIDDSNDAMLVAEKLGIPFQVIDLSEAYHKRIVEYMFSEYAAGRTPNPDVLCNREIKFDVFMQAALKLGADFVATGHYCRKEETIINGQKIYQLMSGRDSNKDQSYFLCQVKQEQLAKALFPIGNLQKSEVRRLALEAGLHTAEKKDSQGLCFVGKVKLPVFLQQQLEPKPGLAIEIPANHPKIQRSASGTSIPKPVHWQEADGLAIGEHPGAHFYTVGQRKGLHIGGKPEPLFVIQTDTRHNLVFLGQGAEHPALYAPGLFIKSEDVHWIREDLALKPGMNMDVHLRIRYRQEPFEARLDCTEEGMYVHFANPQKSVTPGQFAAWYVGDELLGSGAIFF